MPTAGATTFTSPAASIATTPSAVVSIVGASLSNVTLVMVIVLGGTVTSIVSSVMAIMSGVFQINPIWKLGPYDPTQVSAGSQPDFYMAVFDGAVRKALGYLAGSIRLSTTQG